MQSLKSLLIKNIFTVAYNMRNNSKYGWNANAKIWINNSSSASASSYAGCQYAYDTVNGQKASTAHNIYGVYDMSGGADEYVAAYVNGGSFALSYGQNILDADAKYKNIYIVGTDSSSTGIYNTNKNVFGEALYETSSSSSSGNSWYGDNAIMPSSTTPWLTRGGKYDDGTLAGLFNFRFYNGNVTATDSFRPVVVILP